MTKTKLRHSLFAIMAVLALLFFSYPDAKAALVGNTTQATLSLSPQSGAYNINDTFPVSVNVNTNGRNIFTVAAYLNYNPDVFQAVSTDLTGSVFTPNFENVIDATNGKIKITQAIPAPGVNTASGLVARVNFKALAAVSPSSDNITFDFTSGSTTESNVLDGTGTDYLTGVNNGRFTVNSSASTPSQTPTGSFALAGSLFKYPNNPTVYLLASKR